MVVVVVVVVSYDMHNNNTLGIFTTTMMMFNETCVLRSLCQVEHLKQPVTMPMKVCSWTVVAME